MASRKSTEMKQRLLAERDRLLREREALDNQISGLERAIALVSSDGDPIGPLPSRKRQSTKSIVLGLLEEVGTTGLNAAIAVDLANRRGVTVERSSVSSLLSRFKSEDVVVFDGDRYRLPQFAPKQRGATDVEMQRTLSVVGAQG